MCKTIKGKIKDGKKVTGIFLGIYSPALVEICGYAGFDFIVIDDEHGAFSYSELENMIRTAELVKLAPIVRVSYDEASIQKALDRGAIGVQVPMVSTREDAIQVVKKVRFPPLGNRGVAYSHRAARYGKDTGKKFIDQSNDEVLVAVHIETREAVENFEEIMNVEGIDLAFLGTTDLSVNMGYQDGFHHQEVQEAIALVYKKAKELGIPIGTVAGNESAARQAFEAGSVYVVTVGTTMIANSFSSYIKSVDSFID